MEILVVANNVPVVNPVLRTTLVEENDVATRLVTVWFAAAIVPAVILPVASKVPVLRPVDKTRVLPEALVKRNEEVVKLAVPRLAVEILVFATIPPVVIFVTVNDVTVAFVITELVASNEDVVIPVLAMRIPVVIFEP